VKKSSGGLEDRRERRNGGMDLRAEIIIDQILILHFY
jgi:hypothetical protein